MMRAVGFLLLLGMIAGCRREPVEIHQEFLTVSGMAATLYPPRLSTEGAPRSPGVILLHDLGQDQQVWTGLIAPLRREGFAVLALDLPGHGALRGDWREQDPDDWPLMVGHLREANRTLTDIGGVDPARIAYVGAGLGANLALATAQVGPEPAALVLVSPGWEIQGVDVRGIVGGLAQRPVLLIAAEGDSYATATANGMKAEAPGFCELRLYPGTAHGVGLLDTSEHAREQLTEWLKLVLSP